MKCTACNKTLSDKESTFKDYRGEYPDTCFECLRYIFDTFEGENEETVDKEENI